MKQVEAGTAVADVCRQPGISEATFYIWKKKYANLGGSEVRELRLLREENSNLKRLVADLTLDKHIVAEIIGRLTPARRRELVEWVQTPFGPGLSSRRANRL